MDFGNWNLIFGSEFKKEYFIKLGDFVKQEYSSKTIYPSKKDVFNSFKLCDFNDVKVVILGQDPYHQPNQAFGLAFAVQKGIPLPPSLKNIYKELQNDLKIDVSNRDGDLSSWAKQGVLLLNAILTVEHGKPLSHKDKGWEIFTGNIISHLNNDDRPKVFVLWGNPARERKRFITNPRHLIIESPHPSPLSAWNGFFGSKPFSRCNNFLISNNINPIRW